MLACLASKPQKYPITRTHKPKKNYICAIVQLGICNGSLPQLQTNLIYFIASFSSHPLYLFSLLTFQAYLSHISLMVVVFPSVGRGFGVGLVVAWTSGGMAWHGR